MPILELYVILVMLAGLVFFAVDLRKALRSGPPTSAQEPTSDAAHDDGEPVVDIERVGEALYRIDRLLGEGRIDEAQEECRRSLDLMRGVDEATAADARWRALHNGEPA